MYQGNPNASNPYQPVSYAQTRNPYGNLGMQQQAGMNAPQPNTAGLNGGNNTTNYRMPGIQQPPPLNPTPVTPTPTPPPSGPLPYDKYNPATWWWLQPSQTGIVNQNGTVYNQNAVPMGNQNGGPTVPTYLNPNTGLHQYGPGNGWVTAPQSSPYAFVQQQNRFGQGWGGQQGPPGRFRDMTGGY